MPKAKASAAKQEPNFETDLERLEEIVTSLEAGGLSLDDSLKRFEEGIGLARRCESALAKAEKRIEVLTRDANGELKTEPLDTEAAPASEEAKTAEPGPVAKAEGGDEPEPDEPVDEDSLLF